MSDNKPEARAEWYETFIDGGYVPDSVLRYGIRTLLNKRLHNVNKGSLEENQRQKMQFVRTLQESPVAIHTDKANEQHYEVPTEFMRLSLGERMKYSGCLFDEPNTTLDEAEEKMMELYCIRAELEDGMKLLDLGCGWGSLGLFLAEKYPNSQVTCLSNSSTQKIHIMEVANQKGLSNINVITGNVLDFEFEKKPEFDRILTIEMLEHMKNYMELFQKLSNWLKAGGKLFVHIFCHKSIPYDFDENENNSWMARYFFTGGTMPSLDLFLYFQHHFNLKSLWYVNGTHYGKTCNAWLKKLDKNYAKCIEHLAKSYGNKEEAIKWFYRWRVFYIACEETFNFGDGNEWGIGHYLFTKKNY